MIEAGIVAAVITRLAGMHLFRQRLELNGVGTEGERIVLLLIEEFLAGRIDHARRLLRTEHRVRINLHALPGRRIGDVVGVPPLHFHVDERGAGAPRHRDAVGRHFARAGRSLYAGDRNSRSPASTARASTTTYSPVM